MIDFKPLLAQLAALPNLTSTTPGPTCPACGAPFVVAYGRRSKAWLVLHGGRNRDCPRYGERHPRLPTQADAIRYAQNTRERPEGT